MRNMVGLLTALGLSTAIVILQGEGCSTLRTQMIQMPHRIPIVWRSFAFNCPMAANSERLSG